MIFYCKDHPEVRMNVTEYSILGNGVHKDRSGNKLVCPTCGIDLISEVIEGDFKANIGAFSSMSRSDKQTFLKKRSKLDSNKKENRERKTYMDTNHLDKH